MATITTVLYLTTAAFEVGLGIAGFTYLFGFLRGKFASDSFTSSWRVADWVGIDIACKTVSAAFAILAASTGAFNLLNGAEKDTPGVSETEQRLLKHIFLVVIAYFLYDLYAMHQVFAAKAKTSSIGAFCKEQPLLVAHHLAIGAFFTPLMTQFLGHEPGPLMVACALVFEASTPFVSLRAVLSHLRLKRSLAYALNGLVMMAVFFACRIVVYPVFYAAYARQRGLDFSAAVLSTPKLCAFFMVLVLLPQIYWFKVMVSGAVKVIQERNNNDQEHECGNGIKINGKKVD